LLAKVTGQARTVDPLIAEPSQLASQTLGWEQSADLDARVVSDLDVFHKLTTSDDNTGTFMASY